MLDVNKVLWWGEGSHTRLPNYLADVWWWRGGGKREEKTKEERKREYGDEIEKRKREKTQKRRDKVSGESN